MRWQGCPSSMPHNAPCQRCIPVCTLCAGVAHTRLVRPACLNPPPPPPSLPSPELELEEGDVLNNKQRVWDNAEEQAAVFRAHLEELREQGFDFEAEAENHN